MMDLFEKAELAKTMDNYDPMRKCLKCENAEVTTVYDKGHSCTEQCSMDHPEHFVRTCQRCHYQWLEAVGTNDALED